MNYTLKAPSLSKMDQVELFSPETPSTFFQSLILTDQDGENGSISDFLAKLQTLGLKPLWEKEKEFIVDGIISIEELEDAGDAFVDQVQNLLDIISKRKAHCKHLAKFGGSSCFERKDSYKVICLDEKVKMVPEACLVYSFGVGHDMSFDFAMNEYGCEVFAFDSDRDHKLYPTVFYNGIIFLKFRLGSSSYTKVTKDDIGTQEILYHPIHKIIQSLNHQNRNIDVLKIDIEGSEWKVFERNIFKTKILERTKQLSLEIHLSYFIRYKNNRNVTTSDQLLKAVEYYTRILKGLEERGFYLAHFEPNYWAPKIRRIHNKKVHIFSETLWINPNFYGHVNESFIGDFYKDYTYPPEDTFENKTNYEFENF